MGTRLYPQVLDNMTNRTDEVVRASQRDWCAKDHSKARPSCPPSALEELQPLHRVPAGETLEAEEGLEETAMSEVRDGTVKGQW